MLAGNPAYSTVIGPNDSSGVNAIVQVTHSFNTALAPGANPEGGLTAVGSILFGTTTNGGTYGRGTVFSMNEDGSNYQVLHSFAGESSDGEFPLAALTVVGSVVYGTTGSINGSNLDDGTVFSMNLDGSNYHVLHFFTGSSNYGFTGSATDGAGPLAELKLIGSALYGTTFAGGTMNYGTIFSINLDGSNFRILHSFIGGANDGANPAAGLTAVGSTLFGTTLGGGAFHGLGTAYSMNIDGSNFQLLHSFGGGNGSDSYPASGLTVVGSTLFGTTGAGESVSILHLISNQPGTLFSMSLDGSNFQTIHAFAGGSDDGGTPVGWLYAAGSTLVGTTFAGGSSRLGTLFSINADGSDYQIVHSFEGGNDCAYPYSGLIPVGSALYGTSAGGGNANLGTVYSLTLPPPEVTNIEVGSSNWSSSYLSALHAEGYGDGGGYAIPVGASAQLQDLPWGNLNQIRIAFNQNVNIQENSLTLAGQSSGQILFSRFTYDPTTFLATWSLASPLPNDRLTLHLQSTGPAAVTNVLGTPLDGNWTNGTNVYPSGNGTTGDFDFAFNVLSGDLNQDGIVNAQDIAYLSSSWLQTGGLVGDTNGDDILNAQDIALVSSNWLATLPPAIVMASGAAMASIPMAMEFETGSPSMPHALVAASVAAIGPSFATNFVQPPIMKDAPLRSSVFGSSTNDAEPSHSPSSRIGPAHGLVDVLMSQGPSIHYQASTSPSLWDPPEEVLLSLATNRRTFFNPEQG